MHYLLSAAFAALVAFAALGVVMDRLAIVANVLPK
jgi:hypothetical protein